MIRLTEKETQAIKETFQRNFYEDDHIWLFGSRVHPEKKGGDIDLYVETRFNNADEIFKAKLNFLVDLKMKIGDQKIDLVINSKHIDLPIYAVAKKEGVLLI